MSLLFADPFYTALDTDGTPLSGAKLSFTLTTTTTPATVYTNNGKTVAHTNPVVADSAGRFPAIYLDESVTYRARLYKSDGTTLIKDVDPVNPSAVDFAALTSGQVTSALGFTPADETVQINVGVMFTGGGALTGDVAIDLANIGSKTLLGNAGAASAQPSALTRTQARALVLPDFTGHASHLLQVNAGATDAGWAFPYPAAGSFAGQGSNGACTVNAQTNVSGVSRTSAGTYAVTFTTPISGTYHVAPAARFGSGANCAMNLVAKSSTGFTVFFQQGNATVGSSGLDPAEVTFACHPVA
jgi:hypothetical protein